MTLPPVSFNRPLVIGTPVDDVTALIDSEIDAYALPVIKADTTLLVNPNGGDEGDLESTLNFLRLHAIAPNVFVTIKMTNGNYYPEAQINNPHPQGDQLRIIGNQGNRDLVKVFYPADNGRHFMEFTDGNGLNLIDGMTVQANNGWLSHGVWNEAITPYGCGILNLAGGRVNVGSFMYFTKCYYGLRAEQGGAIACSPGLLVNEAGDVAFHAYNGGHMEASGTFCTNASHAAVGLGTGYLSELGGTIKAAGANVTGCYLGGVSAYSNGVTWGENALTYGNQFGGLAANGGHVILVSDGGLNADIHNNQFGVKAEFNGSIELSGSLVRNNTLDGVVARTESSIDVTNANIHDNGGLGVFADSGQVVSAGGTYLVNNASYGAKATNGGNVRFSGANTVSNNTLGPTQIDSLGSFIAGVGPTVVSAGTINYGPGRSLNYDPQKYRTVRQALAATRIGTATGASRTKVAVVGHSLPAGFGSGTGTPPNIGARLFRPATRLAAYLNSSGLPAVQESQYGTDGMSRNAPATELKDYDARFTYTTGDWTFTNDGNAFGGAFWVCNTATTAITFTPTTTVDTFEVLYVIDANKGTINFTIDNAAPATGPASVNSLGSTAIGTAVLKSISVGTHALSIKRSGSSPIYIIGVRAYDSTKSQIDVISGGNCGAVVANIAFNGQPYYSLPVLQAIAPSFVILDITDNDEALQTDPTAFASTYTSLVNTLQTAGASVLIALPYHRSDVTDAVFNAYYGATQAIAAATGCAMLDFQARYGSVSSNPSWFRDAVHMYAAGYDDMAADYAQFILNL